MKVHQTRVKPCPEGFLAGYYGNKRKGPGRPPRWVENILSDNGLEPSPADEAESLTESETDRTVATDTDVPVENHPREQGATGPGKQGGRYSLRGKTHPPDRLCQ